jgi:hypothetical protein
VINFVMYNLEVYGLSFELYRIHCAKYKDFSRLCVLPVQVRILGFLLDSLERRAL